jgi:anti-sigma factor RsiW
MTPPVDDFPCNLFVELVTEYLDGALPADETERLEEHLAVCGGCESVLDQFRAVIRTSGALREHDVAALAPDARDRVMTAFREWASTRSGS